MYILKIGLHLFMLVWRHFCNNKQKRSGQNEDVLFFYQRKIQQSTKRMDFTKANFKQELFLCDSLISFQTLIPVKFTKSWYASSMNKTIVSNKFYVTFYILLITLIVKLSNIISGFTKNSVATKIQTFMKTTRDKDMYIQCRSVHVSFQTLYLSPDDDNRPTLWTFSCDTYTMEAHMVHPLTI